MNTIHRRNVEPRPKAVLYATALPMVDATWAYVREVAADLNARVEVLHVLELCESSTRVPKVGPPSTGQRVTDATKQIYRRIGRDRASLPSLGITVLPGDTIDAIVTTAERVRAAMIIIGNSTAPGHKQKLQGSVTPGLLRHARCPVLVVPHEAVPAPEGDLNPKMVERVACVPL